MRNITKQIKQAISADALWSISDFYYLLEKLDNNGFETSHWRGEENWAGLILKGDLIGYIWRQYPLIFLKEDRAHEIMTLINELKYIVLIKSKDLNVVEFTIDMDEDLFSRISYGVNTNGFSANDFWFCTVT